MTTTSLDRRIGNDNFPQQVSRVLRESAELARSSYGDSPFVDNHVHALTDLADLIDSAGIQDQRTRALFGRQRQALFGSEEEA